ncbi:MAG: hypothetical protein U1F60_11765 [Planctomycetota bacterium]
MSYDASHPFPTGAVEAYAGSSGNWCGKGLFVALLALEGCVMQKAGEIPIGARPEGTHASPAAVALSFGDIGGWTYVDGLQGMPESVMLLDGLRVEMVGHLLSIDGGVEALLVESLQQFGVCQEGPGINQVVQVSLPNRPAMDALYKRVKVTGLFSVRATVLDGYCVDIYQLRADNVAVIE